MKCDATQIKLLDISERQHEREGKKKQERERERENNEILFLRPVAS